MIGQPKVKNESLINQIKTGQPTSLNKLIKRLDPNRNGPVLDAQILKNFLSNHKDIFERPDKIFLLHQKNKTNTKQGFFKRLFRKYTDNNAKKWLVYQQKQNDKELNKLMYSQDQYDLPGEEEFTGKVLH